MKQIIKPYFAHILCIVLAALHIGCTEEILPTDTDALNGNHPGVHLTLLPPSITLDGATATRAGEPTIIGGGLCIQLVDADGKVLTQQNGKPQQTCYVNNGSGAWIIMENSADDAEYSQAIIVTGGAGTYRMRIVAEIGLLDGYDFVPFTFFGGVEVSDKGDGTGSFAIELKHNLTAGLQVELVGDNGARSEDTRLNSSH